MASGRPSGIKVSGFIAIGIAAAVLLACTLLGTTIAANHADLVGPNRYVQTNLLSNLSGKAAFTDSNLKNPWGMAWAPGGPFWISDNNSGFSTVCEANGQFDFAVQIALPPGSKATFSAPTGLVYNPTADFPIGAGGPALFIFSTEEGTIAAWNGGLAPVVANLSGAGAIYKGLAMGTTGSGNFLYAPDFHNGKVQVFDKNYHPVTLAGTFSDPSIPAGFAPFGITNIGNQLYVTYAMQDAQKVDDQPGPGNGFVDIFDTQGHLMKQLLAHGALNSPWGVAIAPANFGAFSNDLLVGNLGDGTIHGYNPSTGALLGALEDKSGKTLVIEGLWDIVFGDGLPGKPANTLFFSAGITGQADGLFGSLVVGSATPTPTPTHSTATRTPTPSPKITPAPTPSRTPTRTAAGTPSPTPTPKPGTPVISSIPKVIQVGNSFVINGKNFTAGSMVNFFVATATGPINAGPLPPATQTTTQLTVDVPATVSLGQGFVTVQVVDTDKGFLASNIAAALLQGFAGAGIPTIMSINGAPLSPTSSDPNFATNNVTTVVPQGTAVKLGGTGFDTVYGVAIDLFCACPGGKVGPFFLNSGNSGLTSTQLSFTLPAVGMPNSPATGPGSFVVSNGGFPPTFTVKSNAVSAPIGARIMVSSVSQLGTTITVKGAGISKLTVINFFNAHPGGVVNLGGLKSGGAPIIPLTFVDENMFTFKVPVGAMAGASYVQALNPPFVPFSSSGNGPGGALTLH
jgi:uncharacterized protein (TIGR03118 family)